DISVTWCVGHLLQLTDPENHNDHYKQWSLSHLPIQWPVEYKPKPKTKKQLDVVVRKLKEADQIIISTDIDDAGQHIGDAILEYANLYDDSVERLLINDNHPIKIKQALQDIKKNTDFYGLHLKEKNRAIADMRVGYNLTRLLTKQSESQGYKRLFTVGRVQSAVLGLVVRRY
ncbi:DNA topoisomerase, partial [Grimontia celer]|uniref:DNA topoisomerase n=1 Tax=Grimontia celer TaxID=1796497 RepID=UPI000B0E0CC3